MVMKGRGSPTHVTCEMMLQAAGKTPEGGSWESGMQDKAGKTQAPRQLFLSLSFAFPLYW